MKGDSVAPAVTAGAHELIEDLRDERDRLLKIIEEQAGSVRLLTDQRPETEKPTRRRWWP